MLLLLCWLGRTTLINIYFVTSYAHFSGQTRVTEPYLGPGLASLSRWARLRFWLRRLKPGTRLWSCAGASFTLAPTSRLSSVLSVVFFPLLSYGTCV